MNQCVPIYAQCSRYFASGGRGGQTSGRYIDVLSGGLLVMLCYVLARSEAAYEARRFYFPPCTEFEPKKNQRVPDPV